MFAPVLSNSHQKFLVPLETKENQKAHLGMRNDGQEYRYRIGCGVSAAGRKERGVSRSKLVRLLMQKVVRDELVPNILGHDDLAHAEPPPQRYRRFRNREH
jgi:hypothetical protein